MSMLKIIIFSLYILNITTWLIPQIILNKKVQLIIQTFYWTTLYIISLHYHCENYRFPIYFQPFCMYGIEFKIKNTTHTSPAINTCYAIPRLKCFL